MGHGCWQEWLGAVLQIEGLEQEQTPGKRNFPITPMERKAK